MDFLPEHLIVIGGSYVSLEFAQRYRRFGSEVTIVEMGMRLIQREDEDVSEAINTMLENGGINIRLSAECIALEKRGKKVAISVDCSSGDKTVVGSHVLLAVGRVPNTEELGLENAGVAVDQRGYIQVDDQLRTKCARDLRPGRLQRARSFHSYFIQRSRNCRRQSLDGDQRRVSNGITAYALYIDPPLQSRNDRDRGAKVRAKSIDAKRPMASVGRAVAKGETQEFMKVLVYAGTKEILGAVLLGHRLGEQLQVLTSCNDLALCFALKHSNGSCHQPLARPAKRRELWCSLDQRTDEG